MKNDNYKQPLIFIVDDDEDDLFFIKSAISNTIPNSTIKCFIHGKHLIDGLSDAETDLPSFILMDLNMPIYNGKETLQYLKKNDILNKIPVVIFTTSNNPNEKALCLKYGASNYLSKPSVANVYEDIMQTLKRDYIDCIPVSQ
ncbi:MAG: response regulator [Bacteroidia bacterium]